MISDYIPELHAANGTFLAGYTGYDFGTLWNTVLEGYLQQRGHFGSNADYGWEQNGAPYIAVIDKATMEILEIDLITVLSGMPAIFDQCNP